MAGEGVSVNQDLRRNWLFSHSFLFRSTNKPGYWLKFRGLIPGPGKGVGIGSLVSYLSQVTWRDHPQFHYNALSFERYLQYKNPRETAPCHYDLLHFDRNGALDFFTVSFVEQQIFCQRVSITKIDTVSFLSRFRK